MINLSLKRDKTSSANSLKITRVELERLNQLKELDIQQCSFCHQINILNLGWEPFPKLLCQSCQEEHVLCPELCLKVARNILGCDLYVALPKVRPIKLVETNRLYDKCNCYLCFKELRGAGKTGKIKNRNNPSFWGVESDFKIMCLECIGKRYLSQFSKSKQKTYQKYLRRGYV